MNTAQKMQEGIHGGWILTTLLAKRKQGSAKTQLLALPAPPFLLRMGNLRRGRRRGPCFLPPEDSNHPTEEKEFLV